MSQWNKDYDKYIKENTAATNKKIEERTAGLNQIVDNATNQAVGKVQTEIDKLPTAYQSAYDVNAIQQKINEREVAERMANLGLTNSGLNRTQQTAINIQRSNADAALTQQKNAATASLKQQIADLYASGENQKAQNKLNVYNTYMDELDSSAVAYANNQATNRANVEKARLAVRKAEIEAAAKKEQWMLENGYTHDSNGEWVKLDENGFYLYDDEQLANKALEYFDQNPTVTLDSRTLDMWLNDNKIGGEMARKFKAYLQRAGAKTSGRR